MFTNNCGIWLGETATTTIGISNPNNTQEPHKIRVYFQLTGDGQEAGNIYVEGLSYSIGVTRQGDTEEGKGKDFLRAMSYEDILQLPPNTAWREGVLEAIRNGNYRMTMSGRTYQCYVVLNNQQVLLYSIYAGASQTGTEVSVTEAGEVVVKWTYANPSATNEMPLYETTITYGPAVICVTDSNIVTGSTYSFLNTVNLAQYFTHSDAVMCMDDAINSVVVTEGADFTISKGKYNTTDTAYLGESYSFYVELQNSGMLPYGNLIKLEDPLPTEFYMKPTDMQTMFATDQQEKNSVLSIRIQNATLCAEVPGRELVTGTDGELYYLNNATSGVNTEYSGLETQDSVETEYADLCLQWNATGEALELIVARKNAEPTTYTIGTGANYATITDAFDALGYLVTRQTQFIPTWTFADAFKLYGGQTVRYDILSTIKDSFMYTDADVRNRVMDKTINSTNIAYAYYTDESGTEQAKTASQWAKIGYDFNLNKGATVEGTTLTEDMTLQEGDVVTYSLLLEHNGTTSYYTVPLVDHLQGGQILLVPETGNEHLRETYALTAEAVAGGTYYVLDKPGTYRNVLVGTLLADAVIVTEAEDGSGLRTLIHWYLTDVEGNCRTTVTYKAWINAARSNSRNVISTLKNEVWAGDHQSHRLWDTVYGYSTRLAFDKSIVTDIGTAVPDDDALTDFSVLQEGAQVTYRFTLRNTSAAALQITGANIYDILPASVENFWDKDAIIEIRYTDAEGNPLSVVNGTHWDIASQSPDGASADNRQYLCWKEDFSMEIAEVAYIYVTLQCPTGDTWKQYVQTYADTRLQNDLIVYNRQDTVYHDLAVAAEALLQKGVYQTGLQVTGSSYTKNPDADSRLYYSNDDAYRRFVLYYVTLYNDGDGRLYINDLQDVLPTGFTFYGIVSGGSNGSFSSVGVGTRVSGTTVTAAGKVFTLSDAVHTQDWKLATVTAATELLESGEQKIIFSLKSDTLNASNPLLYDEILERYYLEPGDGIQFVYACRTNAVADTENAATNTVMMPYYDYTGAGVKLADAVTIVGADAQNVQRNDGDCEILEDTTGVQWLSSEVTLLRRSDIVPGITKEVQDADGYAGHMDVVNWKVTVSNTGNHALTDYTVTDVMQKPYGFTDTVRYTLSPNDVNGTNLSIQTDLFTVTERTETALVVKGCIEGEDTTYTLPLDGTVVPIAIALKVNQNVYQRSTVNVSVAKQTDGSEVLTLHFPEAAMSIPGNGHGVLEVATVNTTTVFENKVFYNAAYLTPNTQTYDSDLVSQGNNVLYKEKPSVRNSSSITISTGYMTSSEKKVEEEGNPENAASSNDSTNYILLPGKETPFRFTLQVNNTNDIAMEKLILIDNLPQPDDHSTFSTAELRYSAFQVSLADEPNFTVKVISDGKETILTSTQYQLQFSNMTEFSSEDWKGENAEYWKETADAETRSFRIILTDAAGTLIPANAIVTVSFTAKVTGEAQPGAIAWNSFGYHYKMLDATYELEAAPLKVGVHMPEVPQVQKKLTFADGTPFEAEQDETFRFLLYEGEAISALEEVMTEDAIKQLLSVENRKYFFVELQVKKGQSVSEKVLLQDWEWVDGAKYTIMELPLQNTDVYEYHAMNDSTQIGYTFTYNPANKNIITCVNYRKSWTAVLHKTDADTGEKLAGAIFGLYSPDQADQLSDAAYTELQTQLGFAPRKTVTVNDVTYYLVEVQTSDAKGKITWTRLIRETYAVCELRAPKGYFISVDPKLIHFQNYENTVTIEIPNRSYYELPSSAGEGIFLYVIGGVGTMLLSISLLAMMGRKRRKEVR